MVAVETLERVAMASAVRDIEDEAPRRFAEIDVRILRGAHFASRGEEAGLNSPGEKADLLRGIALIY